MEELSMWFLTGLCLVFSVISSTSGTYDCYNAKTGSYNGTVAKPLYHQFKCLNWDDPAVLQKSDSLRPDVEYHENYCRFIEDYEIPVCYAWDLNMSVFAIFCEIFACDAHAGCFTDTGTEYRDTAMYTEEGFRCLHWWDVVNESVNPYTYPDADLRENYCRNPDDSERPWCYYNSTAGDTTKGFCQLEQCNHGYRSGLGLFRRTPETSFATYRPLQRYDHVESAEECAHLCLTENQFTCASFIYTDFTKHIGPRHRRMLIDYSCVWTNVSTYTIDIYNNPTKDDIYRDLFTRTDNLCDYFLVDTYPELCPLPLGLETGLIRDHQINASSSIAGHPPQHARLNGNSSWIPDPRDYTHWIQFEFPERMIFSGVVVQGGGDRVDAWVEFFVVYYSYALTDSPTVYNQHAYSSKEFRANAEPNCPKAIYFDPPIRANTLRIEVVLANYSNAAMRMELLGCKDNDCDYTLGLINGQTHDSQITASTSLSNALYSPSHARLQPSYGKQGTGWRPSFSSPGQYLQVDFLEDMYIKAVVTQGCGLSELRVRNFTITWKREKEGKFLWIRDGHFKTNTTITNATEGEIFVEVPTGVFSDNGTRALYRNDLKEPLIARQIRIYPKAWVYDICMRVEFIGCKHQVCVDRLGMESGDIMDSQISGSSQQSILTESRFARLYDDRCWMPEKWSSHHYIQIDFNGLHTITGLITQGGRVEDPTQTETAGWADSMRLLYRSREDRNTWKVYEDIRGRDVEFFNYPDPDTETRHVLDRPVMTDGIRISPNGNNPNKCLRLEFIGCDTRVKGHICEGLNTEYNGYCLRTVDTQEETGCEDIFSEGSNPVVIQSAKLQKFFEDKKERFQLPFIYQYIVGLQKLTSHTHTPFVWLPESSNLQMTYENFRWLPDSIANNNTIEMCVYLDMDDSMKWRAFHCRDVIVSRATICQIDMDECLKVEDDARVCSHDCLNVPGGFHCQCPRGYHLTSLYGTVCRRLDTVSTPLVAPPADYYDPVLDYDFEYDAYDTIATVPPMLVNFTRPVALTTTFNTSHVQQLDYTIPDKEFAEISIKHLADIRCEDLMMNSTTPYKQTMRRAGVVQGVAFAPLYNSEKLCEIRITAEEGYFVKFTFHELSLRKSASSDSCEDVLNITDNFPDDGPMLRGSYCGNYRQMVVTSRSSDVVLRFAIGNLTADMPQKLGFIATYETIKCMGTGKGCEPDCGGTEIYRDPSGSFSIDSVADTLAPFSFCNWTIRVLEGEYVALNFTKFNVGRNLASEVCADSLEILMPGSDGAGEVSHVICGDQAPYILTNTSEVKVIFRTGLEVQSEGFQVDYHSKNIPGCGIGTYDAREPIACFHQAAFIASINYPYHYLPNQNITWFITTDVGTYVELVFHWFDVNSSRDCRADYVRIYEDEYEMRFCNSHPPPSPVRSSFNTLLLAFVSDYEHEASGFYAEYKAAHYEPNDKLSVGEVDDPPGIACPPDWVLFKRHCYKFKVAEHNQRWTDTLRDCEAEGASLVSISDVEEMEFVHATLVSKWFTNNTKTYIGLQLDQSQRAHVWRDRTPMSYSDWSVPIHHDKWKMRQPNGGDMEECSLIELTNLHSTNHWHDVPCASTDTSQYICEKPAEINGEVFYTERSVEPLVKQACPDNSDLVNNQCITISEIESFNPVLINSLCPPGLQLITSPDPSIMEFYMDYVTSHTDVRGIVEGASTRPNGTLCRVFQNEDGKWKMRDMWCDEDTNIGGVFCATSSHEKEQICSPNLFQCSSEECVQRVQLCDGSQDCEDGSDEELCTEEKSGSEFFRCGSGEYIQISFLCDHDPQCLDSSDENDCDYPNCSEDQFTCASSQCISMDRRCDLITHCVDGTDETECESSDAGFQCYDGNWIPLRAYCDGVKDCQGNSWEDEPQECRPDPLKSCSPGEVQCGSGNCVDRSTLCLYDFDRYGYQTGCRDVAHLRHCDLFECSNFTFKCPHSYCIPLHRRCDDRWDCPSGEDENDCDNYTCPRKSYRCRGSRQCLTQDLVCDGVRQCPGGDDEWLCAMECPSGCVCTGLSYSCDVITDTFLTDIPSVVRRLNLSDIVQSYGVISKRSVGPLKDLSIHDTGFLEQLHRFTMLTELDLSKSRMQSVEAFQFQHQVNLRSLYLSDNQIKVLVANSFAGLERLTFLSLIGNPIATIERNAFLHLSRLPALNLNGLRLDEIYPGMFDGLINLRNLSLRGNPVKNIEQGSFVGLNATNVLDVSNIGTMDSLPVFGLDVFHGLDNLTVLVASNYVFCCVIGHSTTCDAPMEQFSSCKDLMRYTFLRISMWLLGLSALLGNAFVLLWRWHTWQRESAKRVQTFLISNLAIADFLMGIYMIIIAAADMFYRDRYMIHADQWTRSFLCQMAGLLSVLSSEASVFLLVLITIDRFLGVVFPFSAFRFHTKSVRVVVLCAWVLALFLSTLPLALTPGDQFYGRSSVCLALPLTSDKPPGWMYSVVLFVGINFACFILIFVCYFIMFVAIRRASMNSTRRREVAEEVKMATKMALIVGTDLLCWMPIIIMALLSLSGAVEIPQDTYAVVAVFILPVNSAANPYLYTISTLDRSCDKTFRRSSTASPTPSTWKSDCTRDLSVNEIELVKVLRTNSLQPANGSDKHKSGIMPAIIADLTESHLLPILTFRCRNIILSKLITRTDWHLKDSEVATIENDLKKALDMLHRCGFLHGDVNEEHVVIDQSSTANRTGAYLIMRGAEIESADDAFGASDEDGSSDDETCGGSIYDNQHVNISDQEEKVSLIRKDMLQLKSLILRLRTLC